MALACGMQEQDETSPEHSAADVLDALEAVPINARGWVRGDVLLRFRTSADTVNHEGRPVNDEGVVVSREHLYRIAFDHEQGRYSVLEWKRSSELDLARSAADENPLQEEEELSARSVDGSGLVRRRDFPGGMAALPPGHPAAGRQITPDDLQIPELRVIPLGSPFVPDALRRLEDSFQQFRARPARVTSHRAEGSPVGTISILHDLKDDEVVSEVRNVYRFDYERLLPLEVRVELVRRTPSPRDGSRTHLSMEKSVAWQEQAGLNVPVRVRSREYVAFQVNGREQYGYVHEDMDIHWFSLNEALEEACFDGRRFADIDAFMDHIDPQRAGAGSLLDDKPLPSGDSPLRPR